MNLRAKLILVVFILSAFYLCIILILPTQIILSDVSKVGQMTRDLIISRNEQLLKDQEVLVESIFERELQSIDSILHVISQNDSLGKAFNEISDTEFTVDEQRTIWKAISQISSFDPDIGAIQLNSLSGDKTITLGPAEAPLHLIEFQEISKNLLYVKALPEEGEPLPLYFLGLLRQDLTQDDVGISYIILFDWDQSEPSLDEIKKDIGAFASLFDKAVVLDMYQAFVNPIKNASRGLNWAIKDTMIQLLIPLVVQEPIVFDNQVFKVKGVARIGEPLDQGVALLAHEVMANWPVFDALAYYKEYQPPEGSMRKFALGSELIINRKLSNLLLANTLKGDKYYLSIGVAMDPIAKELSQWTRRELIILVEGKIWSGYSPNGERFPNNELPRYRSLEGLKSKNGLITIDNKLYSYVNIGAARHQGVELVELIRIDDEGSAANLALEMTKKLSWQLIIQLFVVSVIAIFVIMTVLSRLMVSNVLRPISALAKGCSFIAKGQYQQVVLPQMGKRKDEIAILTDAFGSMVQGLQEKEKIRGVLNKVVSKDVANEILKSNISLGGEDRQASVLFADVRGFTQISHHLSPQEVISKLNHCMTWATKAVDEQLGVVDKYIGDAVMAIFGAPTSHEDHAIRAIKAAVHMRDYLKQEDQQMQFGIGINSGTVVAGNMGAEDRLNYTVLGDNVNLASRLCGAAKALQILISENTLKEPGVKEAFNIQPLEPIKLKGFAEPVTVYEVLSIK